VSTSPEGINYLVQHERTGLLSSVGDADALATNIIRVLRDPQLASRLISGGLEQLEQYRWDVVQEQWLDVYRSLAPEKSIIRKHSA
jgi:glycosyltransferase involved in cell wall biosynthesis